MWLWIFLAAAAIFVFLGALSARLRTVRYTLETDKLEQTREIRLVLLTDLHSCRYGEAQTELKQAIDLQKPALILLGGDIIDDRLPPENALCLLDYLGGKYDCFYVSGNHECRTGRIEEIKNRIRESGVTVLEGESKTVSAAGQEVVICGVGDPDEFGDQGLSGGLADAFEKADKKLFTILLVHRPELIDEYLKYSADLILAGHAHGGQWRIPGVMNGLYAPSQGLFPKYAGGRYDFDGRTLLVSRGLARESTIVPRIFNRPELVVVDIKGKAVTARIYTRRLEIFAGLSVIS